jgi:ELWxxDGT repeat protein
MRVLAALMAVLMLTSLLAGCASSEGDSEKDEQIESLQSELANLTAEADDSSSRVITLETALGGALASVEEMNETMENLSTRLSAAEWHKVNLTYELSEAMAQLNQSEDEELMGQLEDQIENLSAQISEADSHIASLNSEITQKQNEINQLNATITALQSTMNSLTYNVRNRVDSCPLDNPGLEMVVGYDDGAGAASSGDGQVNFDEIQFSVGECPGDDGMILEFQNNSGGWGPAVMATMGGNLYFAGDDGIHGWELWRSDGTIAGTYMVKDLREEECVTSELSGEETCENGGSLAVHCWGGTFGCHYPEMVAGNEKIFFVGFDGEPGTESAANLIVSDGTDDGTFTVRHQWHNWGTGYDGENGWRQGYAGASQLLVIPSSGFNPDRVVYSVLQVIGSTEPGGASEHPPSGEELWISDGTDQGTLMLVNLVPEDESWVYNGAPYCCGDFQGSAPRDLIKKGNYIWFTAETDNYGRELYRYGLSAIGGGLFLIKDINTGTEGSDPMYLTSGSNGAYLSADDGSSGQELYFSQGDAFSTKLVKNIWPGANNSSEPMHLIKFGDKLVFTANDGQNGRELWISDSTEAGTFMIKDIDTNGSSDPNEFNLLDGTLYFMAETDEYGRELWRSDGTSAGTYMVKDINPGNNSSFYWDAGFWSGELTIVHQGELYFTADDGGTYGVEVWRSDGTSEGTRIAVDVNPGENSSWPLWYTSVGKKLFFQGVTEDFGRELWYHWDNPGPIIVNSEDS